MIMEVKSVIISKLLFWILLVIWHWPVQLLTGHSNGLMQDCSISIANALEIMQSCPKPSICIFRLISVWCIDRSFWIDTCDEFFQHKINGLVQDCSTCISIANALEILQSSTKPSNYVFPFYIISHYICTEMVQEILRYGRQRNRYPAKSVPHLLLTLWFEDPGLQQP